MRLVNPAECQDDLWWYEPSYVSGSCAVYNLSADVSQELPSILDKDGVPFTTSKPKQIGFIYSE